MALSDDWTFDYGNKILYQSVGDDATVDAAYQDDGGAFTDETTDANSAAANDVALLPATPAENDAFYIGSDAVFSQAKVNIGTAGAGTWTITWEYYDRLTSAWTALANVTDGTTGFTTSGTNTVTFDRPDTWGKTVVNSATYFWVRGRVSAYTSVTTQPLGTQIWAVKKAASVNDLYSYVMDTFDESEQMEDTVPMDAPSPQSFTLKNQWYISQYYPRNSFHYLTGYNEGVKDGGTIESEDWTHPTNTAGLRRLTFASGGYTNAVAGDIGKVVTGGTTGDTGDLIDYDNTNRVWVVRCAAADDLFDNGSEAITIASGTGAGTLNAVSTTGEWQWANLYTLASIVAGSQIYVEQDDSIVTAWWDTGHIDILLLTKQADVEIDNAALIVYNREYGNAFNHFAVDVTAGARSPVPIGTTDDVNNTTARGTVAAYSIGIFAISGELAYDNQAGGTFSQFDTVTGGTSGATASVINDDGAGALIIAKTNDNVFQNNEQISNGSGVTADVDGVDPLDETVNTANLDIGNGNGDQPYNIFIDASSSTPLQTYEFVKYYCDCQSTANYLWLTDNSSAVVKESGNFYRAADQEYASPTYTETVVSPLATFAGGTIFGRRGVAIIDLSSSAYELIDADGDAQVPPVTVTGEVTGLADLDRVGVFELTGAGGAIEDTYAAAAGNNSGNGTLVISTTIGAYHPSSGFVRIKNTSTSDDYDRYAYTSYTASTFTLSGTLSKNYDATDPVFVPFLDEQKSGAGSLSAQYVDPGTATPVIVRVRQSGIKPFEVESDADGGFSIPAVRTTDNVVT